MLRRSPSERLVSGGKPAEAPNCLKMRLGGLPDCHTFQGFAVLVRESIGQADRIHLIVQMFTVFEGQIEKHPHDLRHVAIESGCNSVAADLERFGVGRKRSRSVTEHVARELVQQQHQCEASSRLCFPAVKTPTRCVPVAAQKEGFTKPVEVRVGDKPSRQNLETIFGAMIGREPEIEDTLRVRTGTSGFSNVAGGYTSFRL